MHDHFSRSAMQASIPQFEKHNSSLKLWSLLDGLTPYSLMWNTSCTSYTAAPDTIFFCVLPNLILWRFWHLQCMLDYLSVSRIQGTLTWITGSLICVCDLFACVYTQGASIYSLICMAFVENLHRIWLWRNRRALVTHPCGHHARLCTTNSSTSSTCQSWKLYTIYHCSVTAHTTWFSTLLYDYTPVKCLEWSFSESVAEPPVNIQWPLWCERKVPTCSSVLPDPLSHCCWHCGYNCPQNTGQPVQGKGEYCTVSNC